MILFASHTQRDHIEDRMDARGKTKTGAVTLAPGGRRYRRYDLGGRDDAAIASPSSRCTSACRWTGGTWHGPSSATRPPVTTG